MSNRLLVRLAASTAAACLISQTAAGADYPTKPVRIIVGFAAGSTADITARLMAQWLSQHLGQQFLVEDRPGAGTNIATEAVAHSPADGYTLLLATSSAAINAALYEKLNFNFLHDIAPIASIVRAPLVMQVNPSVPAATLPEFLAYAKANPGKLSMASGGSGSASHVSGELFKMMTGVDLVHVPYRGDAPAIADVVAGEAQVIFSLMPASINYIRGGKLRPLAVTASTRSAALPDTPTVGQFVPGYDVSAWSGLAGPQGTRAEIVEKLNGQVNAGLADPTVVDRFASLGTNVFVSTPAAFQKFIVDETEKWARVVKFSGARPD